MADEAKPEVNKINVRVKNQGGEEIHFALKSTTKLSKMMQAYADRQGQPVDSFRFVFDGERLNPDHTVDDAGLEDQDSIDAFQEQVGGHADKECAAPSFGK